MATLRELNRHLASVKTVGQIAGAMRTISTVKYQRFTGVYALQKEYAATIERAAALAGNEGYPEASEVAAPLLVLLIGSNRGFCGSYNSELFAFEEGRRAGSAEVPQQYISINSSARKYLAKAGGEVLLHLTAEDNPSADLCGQLTDLLLEKFERAEISGAIAVKQHYVNALTQRPESVRLLPIEPAEAALGSEDIIFEPDRETIARELYRLRLAANIRNQLLDASVALQAASMVAMRSAYDNSLEVSSKLRLEISRKRQANVTAGVIETASAMNSEDL